MNCINYYRFGKDYFYFCLNGDSPAAGLRINLDHIGNGQDNDLHSLRYIPDLWKTLVTFQRTPHLSRPLWSEPLVLQKRMSNLSTT